MKLKVNQILLITLFMSICFNGRTQSLDQARLLYSEGKFEEAKPAFERIVRQSPNNSSYNQWYGVCCYETGDLENAEKYLVIANNRKVMESYRYLAMLYTGLYRFEEAAEMWEEYIALQNKQKEDTSETEIKFAQVRNLLRMQKRTEDVQIIDSIVIDKNSFLNAYSLSSESGALMSYYDFFKEGRDISSIVFTNQKDDRIYFARPSQNGFYSLYSQTKLLDDWSDEKSLFPDGTNDNNYPFVLSDGVTIYFASKGYESIGGYDIFVTRYNTNTNSYLAPEQMGMPFNSPANDYMMVIDETKGLGWFVSDRNQSENDVCVYLFIPDPSRKRLESVDDPEELRVRSSLVSIKDTWRENAGYEELIKLAHTDMTEKIIGTLRDFEFVVNDKITYYSLNEIKSSEAKNLYSDVIKVSKQIDNLKEKLDELRETYAKGNTASRNQIRQTILLGENQLITLMETVRIQEKKARNAENQLLGVRN